MICNIMCNIMCNPMLLNSNLRLEYNCIAIDDNYYLLQKRKYHKD